MRKRMAGFTIMELLLVVAIVLIITSVAAPLYLNLSNSNALDAATNVLVQDLYQAQTYSRNQSQDSQWGVAINGQTITLFKGSSYATRDTTSDVTFTTSTNIGFSGTSELVYSKLYGLPMTTAAFGLSAAGRTTTVSVNSKGMVDY